MNNVIDPGQIETSKNHPADKFVTHPVLGLGIFITVMYLVFNLVQNVSAPFLSYIDMIFNGPFTRWALALLSWLHAPPWLISLVVDGVLAGVGSVMVFFPSLFTMYFLLGLLEHSGYMARAGLVMDRSMSRIGLDGKSFIPIILGFGCNVPAIYATRTIQDNKTRILTGLLIPFISCSARLPVFLIFGFAFFPRSANFVILSLYLLGILVAAGMGALFSKLLFKNRPSSAFISHLPNYQRPKFNKLTTYAWGQTKEFIKNAGTVILGFSVVLWLLLSLPWGVTQTQDSFFGQLSETIAPALAPAGFGEWEKSGALISGMVAKEMVVSTLGQVYHIPQAQFSDSTPNLTDELKQIGVGLLETLWQSTQELLDTLTPGITLFPGSNGAENTALSQALRKAFTPLSAFAYMVFVLLYVPCMATIAAQRQEFGWRWTMLSIASSLIIPWILAVLVYQGGMLLGLG